MIEKEIEKYITKIENNIYDLKAYKDYYNFKKSKIDSGVDKKVFERFDLMVKSLKHSSQVKEGMKK